MVSALALAVGVAASAVTPAAPDCVDLLPAATAPSEARALEAEDLARLRDIGPPDLIPGDQLIAVSPDGRRAAFHLRRADPATNAYCQGIALIDIAPGARPRLIDSGGELLRVSFDFRGKAAFPTGTPRPIAPRWFPDGRALAFLKSDGSGVRVWRAAADGSGSVPLSPAGMDVEDFRVAADGATLLFSSRLALAAARAAIAREALTGFHYDDRYAPVSSSRPFPPEGDRPDHFALDIGTATLRPATADEIASFGGETLRGPRNATLVLASPRPGARPTLRITEPDGAMSSCPDPVCQEAELTPFWLPDGSAGFVRREGWAREATAIYAWRPGEARARQLLVTTDKFAGCAASAAGLICLRESGTVPRRIEWLDPRSGARRVLFDPNPGFARLRLGQVERLRWRNDHGLEVIGDLVYPVGYAPGRRYPLIVVQYDTRGFLRGGTGDDYPIQLFANRGYAVLSISRPALIARSDLVGAIASGRANLEGLADRRSTLSAVETGVRLAISRGVADPHRIGLTGMSDGASTGAFALIHSRLFAAMAMSHCCFDTSLPFRLGPAAARYFHDIGYPRLTEDGEQFWQDYSVRANARAIDTPVLLQVADDEYMSALESFTALRETNAPIDMFVFPQEHHVKYQPAHRLAIYRRGLAWFDYWLLGRRDPSPDRRGELEHWDRLREEAARRDQIAGPTPAQ